jgi:hypothetical protein
MISKVRRFQQNCFGHLRAPASAPVTSLFECSAFRIKRPSLRIVCSTFRRDARFCGALSVAPSFATFTVTEKFIVFCAAAQSGAGRP